MSEKAQTLRLDSSVQYVKGIGPKRADALEKIGIRTVLDFLTHFPRRYLDRRTLTTIRNLRAGDRITVVGKVVSVELVSGRRRRLVLIISDETGMMECIWFQGLSYVSKLFEVGETIAFHGKVTVYRGPQMVHPEFDKLSDAGESDPLHTGGIIPLYPSTESLSRQGLDSRGFRRVIHGILPLFNQGMTETLSNSLLKSQNLMPVHEAYETMHFPSNWKALERAQYRFKFEELFFLQLFLILQRETRHTEQKGIAFEHVGDQVRTLVERLPFELTSAQKRVLREIREDMKTASPMNRLVQGDVGAGKTVVALLAMLIAVENGYQTALMAPTEILAEQHYLNIHRLLEGMNLQITLLRGKQKAAERREILQGLEDGTTQIVIGTHALVQEGVAFHKLGFVVIDEQHRFGVMQRANLMEKGLQPDVLIMTATPIPRTLALTIYGDLDVSALDEMPPGRLPVRTVWRKENVRDKVYDFIRSEIHQGNQAYIIYPLVEESEKIDLAAATEGFELLSTTAFSDFNLALLHGQMKSDEKESVMQRFKAGEIQILISTTVIEVGIDVPNATVMLIEHAERFGLTQLHQLRGRVGRGPIQSTCILLSSYAVSEDGNKRLKTMESTTDGFKIAEADLEIRGPGELFGTRQSGILNLKVANLMSDGWIVEKARKEAVRIVESDLHLETSENRLLKQTLRDQYQSRFGLIQVG
ncbi:ATP-dependent DNA helicase RecG [candidate division KSB1 bacterium]|nr:ATP-dependent DNA helicase RecG [candidate division KSB1 bacterium]